MALYHLNKELTLQPHAGHDLSLYHMGHWYYNPYPLSSAVKSQIYEDIVTTGHHSASLAAEVWRAANAYCKAHKSAHPELTATLAELVNTYPDLYCSLPITVSQETLQAIPTAVLECTGSSGALFLTDTLPNQVSDELYVTYNLLAASPSGCIFGCDEAWNSSTNAFNASPWSGNGTFWYQNPAGFKNTGNARSGFVGQEVTQYVTKYKCGLQGVYEYTLGNGAAGNYNDNGKVRVLLQSGIVQFKKLLFNRNGEEYMRLVPAAKDVIVDIDRCIVIQNTGQESTFRKI